MRKIILFTALLWAFVGASAQSINTINLFSTTGGEKSIITVTEVYGVKDTIYTVNICISASPNGSLFSIKTFTFRGNDSVQTLIDTTTDANSNGGIPSAWWYVKVKLYSAGIIDTVSNELGPIEVTDSIKKPTVALIGKPYVDSLGNVRAYARINSNGSGKVYWHAAYDSTKVYRVQNRIIDSIMTIATPNAQTVSLFFGNIPLNKMIYCGILVINKAGRDSIVAAKSDTYVPKQAPSCDIDSVYRYSNRFKIRLRVVGFKMETTSGFKFRKLGTTQWLNSIDTSVITGDSIQYPVLNTASILEPESGYEIQAWSRNLLGTTNSGQPQIWYTTQASNPGFFSIRVTKAVAGMHKDLDLNFTVTIPNGGSAVVTPKISEFSDFRTATLLQSFQITSSTENRSEHMNFPSYVTIGKYYITVQGMDSKGAIINLSDILNIEVRNWAMGIDPNYQFADFQAEAGTMYQLFDINGKLVLEGTMIESHEKINLSELPTGIYVYTLHKDNLLTTGKLVKN